MVILCLDGVNKKMFICEVILFNLIVVVIKEILVYFIFSILDIIVLSFIVFGVKSGMLEWGVMFCDLVELVYIVLWMIVLLGFVIIFSILIIILLSNSLICVFKKY